ncbi:MAG: LuxR C-terminal-related transcriptional regulator [Flavobacteriaceae bacterium]|nr:LuxR C-terminal-related transcriptional regulator [Flavobacteriaceae bacterium]
MFKYLTILLFFLHIISSFSQTSQEALKVNSSPRVQKEIIVKGVPQSEFVYRKPHNMAYIFQSGLYFGVITMLIVVNGFFYVNSGDRSFLYYIFLVMAANLTIAYHEGMLYPYIKNTFFKYDLDMFLHVSTVISIYLFFASFLNVKKHYYKNYMFIKGFLILYLITMFSYFVTGSYKSMRLADILGTIYALYLWVFSFFFIKKEKYAKFLTLGISIFLITISIHIMFVNGFRLPFFGNTINLAKVGAIFEALILTYAATYRLRVLKEENLKMEAEIKKYITELYQKKFPEIDDSQIAVPSLELERNLQKLAGKYDLTDRELEVMLQITKGKTNRVIAESLFISVNTVKYHIRNIYVKLDINSREAVRYKVKEAII